VGCSLEMEGNPPIQTAPGVTGIVLGNHGADGAFVAERAQRNPT
jgi:hypothetical protein